MTEPHNLDAEVEALIDRMVADGCTPKEIAAALSELLGPVESLRLAWAIQDEVTIARLDPDA